MLQINENIRTVFEVSIEKCYLFIQFILIKLYYDQIHYIPNSSTFSRQLPIIVLGLDRQTNMQCQ